MNFKEYLQEAKYYKQKDVYTNVYNGVSVEILSWENPYGAVGPSGLNTIVTFRDTETGEEHVYSEDEFLANFQKARKESNRHLDWTAFDLE